MGSDFFFGLNEIPLKEKIFIEELQRNLPIELYGNLLRVYASI
jgi:hypothetical protein